MTGISGMALAACAALVAAGFLLAASLPWLYARAEGER